MASAICVGLLPVLRPRATGKILQDWTGARAASEALKTEIYLYLARAGDYTGTRPGPQLARTAEKIERRGQRAAAVPDRHRTEEA